LTSAGVIDFEIACLRQSPEIIRLCAPHTLISQHIWQHSCASQFCMTRLKDKIENGLNEGRILLLGGQVLIGAGFRTIFPDGFEKLPKYAQTVQMASLWIMTIGLGILLLPAAYHFMVERGENTNAFHELVTLILEWALLPFAVGIGVAAWMIGQKLMTSTGAGVIGSLFFILAVSMWYLMSIFQRRQTPDSSNDVA